MKLGGSFHDAGERPRGNATVRRSIGTPSTGGGVPPCSDCYPRRGGVAFPQPRPPHCTERDNKCFNALGGEAWAAASRLRRTASSCRPDGSSTSVGE